MSPPRSALLATAALALWGGCASPPVDPRFAEVLDWTEEQLAIWSVPGVAIAVVEGGELRHAAGLGRRAWGQPEQVTPETRFRIGSLSKLFTGALVLQEVRAGRLDLHAPAGDQLPGLSLAEPDALDQITLLQLLSHQSGLQTSGLPHACDTDPGGLARVLQESAPSWNLWTPPGELYNYSNNGFALAGYAVEQSAGQPFAALAEARLFAPAGIAASYDPDTVTAGNHALGHSMDRETGLPLSVRDLEESACGATRPSGGLMASANELGRVAALLLQGGEPWLSPEELGQMTSTGWSFSETASYGFGLQTGTYREHRRWSHGGSLWGFLALLWIFPDDDLAVVVLVNSDHEVTEIPEPNARPTTRIAIAVADAFLGLAPEPPAESSVRALADWARYPGTYHSPYGWGTQVVRLEAGSLWLDDVAAGTANELLPYSQDVFQYPYTSSVDGRTLYRSISFALLSDEGLSTWLLSSQGAAQRWPRLVDVSQ